jgi:ABC-type arginine transport system ATPase subunit
MATGGGASSPPGFARALAMDPSIAFFDEPDSGLDPVRIGAHIATHRLGVGGVGQRRPWSCRRGSVARRSGRACGLRW